MRCSVSQHFETKVASQARDFNHIERLEKRLFECHGHMQKGLGKILVAQEALTECFADLEFRSRAQAMGEVYIKNQDA